MKVSRSWMKLYGGKGLDVPVQNLVERIGAQLGVVENVEEIGKKYDGVVVARVVSCVDHPDADRLYVCKIDDGGVTADVSRDKDGLVEVVCGAPNVRDDMLVAWLPPGSTVPSTYNSDPFVLEARELRGVVSNGMLASPKELAISDDHDGILEILAKDVGVELPKPILVNDVGAELPKPGTPFIQLYGLDDIVIDIENKMFTHRPDCFGQLGVAREIAGIQGLEFKSPDWYLKPVKPSNVPSDVIKEVGVMNEIPDLCPRYMLLAMDNITIGPSPVWLQAYLTRVGVRPINNIVDMTNYIMQLTGQPLHAFDFDKVAKDGRVQIVVRKPKPDERMTLLDGKTITPRSDTILICNQDGPIAMGGIMGGNNSEIDQNTKRILIESASFDMYNIRKSSMEHGIFSDAVTRFNKGQSPWQCPAVLYQAAQMMSELSPGAITVGEPIDFVGSIISPQLGISKLQPVIVKPQPGKAKPHPVILKPQPVIVKEAFINDRLGLKLAAIDMAKLLVNVEFVVDVKHDQLTVTAPFWRTDISIPEDLVEEVGRLYGYDKLPLVLPLRTIVPAKKDPKLSFKDRLRDILSKAGANELLTYSFVHGDLIDKVGQNKDLAFKLSNALSPDLQYFRMSLTPSLLDKVHPNIKSGIDELAIFELNKSHIKLHVDDDAGLPKELNMVALAVAAKNEISEGAAYDGAAYYKARTYLDYLAGQLGIKLSYASIEEEPDYSVAKPFDHHRSALVSISPSGPLLGIVGEYKASVRKKLKLPLRSAGFEISLETLLESASGAKYRPLPRFPKVYQDITLRINSDVSFTGLENLLQNELDVNSPKNCFASLQPLGIYQKDDQHKNISFRLEIASYERTLTADEVNKLLDKIAISAHKVLQAERI